MVNVDSESFLAIATVAALAALLAGLLAGGRLPLPVVVLEIVLGIVIGPELLGLAKPDGFIDFFSSLGLGMLFFFAGYEIDFRAHPWQPAAAGHPWLGAVAGARLVTRRAA
jgi:Kef-type K+ transport system membrane component KefB